MNNFNSFSSRKGTNCVKWDCIHFMYPQITHEVLPLWVADMDFNCDENILNSIKERVDKNILGYSAFDEEYFHVLITWFKKRYYYNIKKEDILCSPGIVPAIGILLRSLTKEKDNIIIQTPVYYPFKNMIINNNRSVVENKLISNDGYYYMDFEDLEEKAKTAKMLILCSPHNPIGRVWTKNELIKVVDICIRYNLYLVSDEIHCDIIRKDTSFLSLGCLKDEILNRLIICTAPSKSFNLAGLNLSNIIIFNSKIRTKWINEITNKMAVSNPSPLSISATKAAYSKGESWLSEVNDYIDSNLIYLKEYLKTNLPKVKYIIPEGTYLAWLDFNEYKLTDEEITDLILSKAAVAFDEGKLFGDNGKKFQRVNVACPRSILTEALNRITEVFKDL